MSVTSAAIKFTAFVTVSVLAAVLVINTINRPLESSASTYHAVFTDAEGLSSGSEVRVAGVRVGKVTDVELRGGRALVTFDVLRRNSVPGHTRALARYADLLGGRYLALDPGDGGGGRLADGSTIPMQRTRPALELTSLLNGFKPLFDTINPQEANELARELVAVFQGQSGTVTTLLDRTVSITSHLTDRDQVINQLVTNLNTVLTTMSGDRAQLHTLVDRLGALTSGMARDRDQIGQALDSGGALTHSLATTMGQLTPELSHDINRAGPLTDSLVRNQGQLDAALQGTPELLTRVNRTVDNGSWVNIYVCNLRLSVAGLKVDLGAGPHSAVCR